MNNCCICWFFTHGSRSKIPSQNLVRQRCAVGLISGVRGLNVSVLAELLCIVALQRRVDCLATSVITVLNLQQLSLSL
jgi:hypothetical protein